MSDFSYLTMFSAAASLVLKYDLVKERSQYQEGNNIKKVIIGNIRLIHLFM